MLLAAESRTGLGALDYVMVGVYLVITLAIVAWASRKQSDTDEFFLGGRRMPWLAVGLSIMATLLSSLTYLGLPGDMIRYGVGVFAMYLAFPLSMLFVIPIIIPFFMRMRLTSAYEYLELRFDSRTRILGSILFICLRIGWISMVMYAGSLAMHGMTGWDLSRVILWLGLAATVYTCLGGLRAVVWTDVLQAIMLFGGAAVIVLYVWSSTGAGPDAWWSQATSRDTATPLQVISLDPRVRITMVTWMLSAFFWQICTHASDQVVLQRYSATPTLAAARNSFVVNMVSSFSIGLLLGLAGLALLYYYTRHPERLEAGMKPESKGDVLMPHFFANELPVGFGGLILANFLCDAMQTLVSGVNSIAAVVSTDLLERNRTKETSRRNSLWTARLLTVLLGLVCTGAALGFSTIAKATGKNILDLMPKFNMFLGPLASLFFIGMFLPRATARSAIPAALFALTLSVGWTNLRELSWLLPARYHVGFDLSISWPIAMPCIAGYVAAAILTWFVDGDGRHPGRTYSWWAVMRRPEPPPAAAPDADHA